MNFSVSQLYVMLSSYSHKHILQETPLPQSLLIMRWSCRPKPEKTNKLSRDIFSSKQYLLTVSEPSRFRKIQGMKPVPRTVQPSARLHQQRCRGRCRWTGGRASPRGRPAGPGRVQVQVLAQDFKNRSIFTIIRNFYYYRH